MGAGARFCGLMRFHPIISATFAVGVAVLAAAVLLAAPNPQDETNYGVFRPDNADKVKAGAALYQDHCAACHGRDLEGQSPDWQSRDADGFLPGPPHDETGHTWHHADQVLFDITKYGLARAANVPDYRTRMPAFEDVLDDREIIAIFSFIKSRWPEHIRRRHNAINKRHKSAKSDGR